MKRIIKSDSEFYQYIKTPLYTDDVYAYQIVINNVPSNSGFLINAKRADGEVITDSGVADGETLKYTLSSNMHSVEGELLLRVQLLNGSSTVTEKTFIFDVVKGEKGTINASTDQPVLNTVVITLSGLKQDLNTHTLNFLNPHNVTKEQIGLSNADNTSDKEKPLSDIDKALFNNIKQNTLKAENEILIKDNNKLLPVKGIEVLGKSVQDGTPTLDTPYEIKSIQNPTITFTYGDNVKSVTFDGITLRGVKSGKDRIYTENGKVYFEQNIRNSKPSTFESAKFIEYLYSDDCYKKPSWTQYSQTNDVMSNIGMHGGKAEITGTFHWYIADRGTLPQYVHIYPAVSTDWSDGKTAHQWIIDNAGVEFEYQYLLKTPKVTEITGDSATELIAILEEIKEQEFSVSFSSGNNIAVTGSVTYNQDLNKVIDNLTNAIIALGGTV